MIQWAAVALGVFQRALELGHDWRRLRPSTALKSEPEKGIPPAAVPLLHTTCRRNYNKSESERSLRPFLPHISLSFQNQSRAPEVS